MTGRTFELLSGVVPAPAPLPVEQPTPAPEEPRVPEVGPDFTYTAALARRRCSRPILLR